jgi:ABC-type nitrate/sulfonate/bicarbonate transport system substrate-binding protein
LAALVCCGLLLATPAGVRGAPSDAPPSVAIVYQYGYAYAPLIVMKMEGVLEKQYPATKFDWRVLANGAAIRTGMIANQIQIGAGGVAPFLIGWDRGVGWKLLGSLCDINLWLVARDPKIKSLKDIGPGMRIGMPSPDSIQAIVLRKAAQEQLGNAHALDSNIVAISHPLGLAALKNGELAAHLSNPPYQFEEVADGGHVILRSFDEFGLSTLDSVFATETFEKQFPAFVRTFYQDLVTATALIRHDPGRAAELLARDEGDKTPVETYKRWISGQGTLFTTVPHGYLRYAKFMRDIGMLEKLPSSMSELELSTLGGKGD